MRTLPASQRTTVEVWRPRHGNRLEVDGLIELDPRAHLIIDTRIPSREVGSELQEVSELIVTLAKFTAIGRSAFKLENNDIVVFPGTNHVILLRKFPKLPKAMSRTALYFGGLRYGVHLGSYLRNGPLHPSYCSLHDP